MANQSLELTRRVEFSVQSTAQLIARTAAMSNPLKRTGTTSVLLHRHAAHVPALAPL